MYYQDKIDLLSDIFAVDPAEIRLTKHSLQINRQIYPIIDDVIILSDPGQYTAFVKQKVSSNIQSAQDPSGSFSRDIQDSFSQEWRVYDEILPEHKEEFSMYFDLVQFDFLANKRLCDLGCGNGRWSYFMADQCRELILIDFSDAIFIARKNLKKKANCLFFMVNLVALPFRENFCDFIFCLGVLHHLPTPCLLEVIKLKNYAPELLIFLYYALDNRPFYYRIILKAVTLMRKVLIRIKKPAIRRFLAWLGTVLIYLPLIFLGHVLQIFKLGKYVPLYDFYKNKGIKRIRQDVYDRFFTSIEQRVTRGEILTLSRHFRQITVSDRLPYWHFLCKK